MAIGNRTRSARQRALLRQARTNLIARTARIWSRSGRSLSQGLNAVVQSWLKKVLKEAERDIAAGDFMNIPALSPKAEKVIRDAMREALAQGYWLQHVYMRECEAAVRGGNFRGKVTLSDEMPLTDDELRQALEAFMKGKKVETSSEWHAIIPEDAVEWLKGYTPTLAGVLQKDVLEKVREVVRDSMTQGTSLTQRVKDLQDAEPKIAEMAKRRVEAIARTEVTRADTMGHIIAMKSNPDVLGVEFSAILDSRTTDICESRHGLVMKIDDPKLPYNTPPLHVNCRSILLPATIYEYPDGLLTSHEFEEVPEAKQRPQDIEEVQKLLQEQPEKQEAAAAIAKSAIVETTILPTGDPQKAEPENPPVALPPGITPDIMEYMSPSNSKGTIRGIPKEEIDKKRGTREHKRPDRLTAQEVLVDDRLWKVAKVEKDDETRHHFHHIWIERIKGG